MRPTSSPRLPWPGGGDARAQTNDAGNETYRAADALRGDLVVYSGDERVRLPHDVEALELDALGEELAASA